MSRPRTFRPQFVQLEDRCLPSSFSFFAVLGGGHSPVGLLVEVQIPSDPHMPEVVSLTKFLPTPAIHSTPQIQLGACWSRRK